MPTPGLALEDSFRCGLFFHDPNDKSADKSGLPALNLYIFNATFEASSECDATEDVTKVDVTRFTTFCGKLVGKYLT